MKIWILFLCALVVGASAQSDESASDWDDDWKEYDDEWFKTRLAQLGIYNDEQKGSEEDSDFNASVEREHDEIDKIVQEDIKKYQKVEHEAEDESKINDYQFEDNRSEQSKELNDDADPIRDSDDRNNQYFNSHLESENEYKDMSEPIRDIDDGNNEDVSHSESENDYDDYALYGGDDLEANVSDNEDLQIPEPKYSKDDNIVPLPPAESVEEINRIMEEAQTIIKQEAEKPNDFAVDDKIVEVNSNQLNDIVKETNAILAESLKPNDFAEDQAKENNLDFLGDNEKHKEIDNVNQIDIASKEEVNDDNSSVKAEDEHDDTVDIIYEDLNEDLDKLFETLDTLSKSNSQEDEKLKPADVDYAVNSDESLDDKSDYENIFDSNLSDLFAQHSEAKEDDTPAKIEAEGSENDDDHPIKYANKQKKTEELVLEEVPYINDALLSDDKNDGKLNKSVNVDELSDDQLVQLMKDFEIQHSDVFEVEALSDDHVVNEITLEYGETKVISSENYPAGYPTNRVVDWIITGKGQGIELNVTDLAVNSALGDYLMVKPGQVDDSGAEGIIFSYHLNEPRAFRFIDVDRIFIRFDSKIGMSWMRGFSLTLKVIAPPAKEPEPEPEPEPLLPEPRHTLTVLLGGLTLAEFEHVSDQFRQLVADMATMYINANGVEPGLNTTSEITQLISASICNVAWPGYEQCSQVQFSVPLVYEDEEEGTRLNSTDLQTMWETYAGVDPFTARFRQMGIEEFSVPNDGGVLTVWLVVALGVVVSAAMLAFALWRYSCFEDYSRMSAHTDTDSLYEKRSSGLYPTPHQMLPPLYAEKDYDSARVDMGGFTNRSYAHTDMYDLDSDEDAMPRDRYTTDV
ncbi:FK506-binding protein 5-like isoform X2 [Cydia strobilella]|uniref:FK506-binding protein 5-like isoform X2 n=1 Tax=Cydia strobilella TaxID=1100964 RepID=UPI003003DE25